MRRKLSLGPSKGLQGLIGLLFGLVLFYSGFTSLAFGADFEANYSPQVIQAIQRGVAYLRRNAPPSAGEGSLAAYTMLTAGESPQSPAVAKRLQVILAKVKQGKYSPGSHHYYEAAADIMSLEAADPISYRPQIEAIVQYILSGQKTGGHWFYPRRQDTGGDTSISQYALLGLWAASRAGIEIPGAVWDNAAEWFAKTQMSDGSYAYHPPTPRSESLHSMTTAGVGSLFICRMHLYPNRKNPLGGKKPPPKPKTKFGYLEVINLNTGKSSKKSGNPPTNYKPTISEARINGSIVRGANWLQKNFRISSPVIDSGHAMYYLYTLERTASLADLNEIGTHDWYAEGSQHLIKVQQQDGSWTRGFGSTIQKTAFAVLFLGRVTGKTVGPIGPRFGEGLMRGGTELTKVKDFSELEIVNGQVRIRKNLGPLDELLAELQKPRSVNVAATTNAIIEKVQLGDREGLIGKKALLRKLVKDSRPDVRRIALWALARTADLGDASLFLKSLDDPNIDVVVEGHNALCFLSRNLQGFGLPASPLEGVPEEATLSQRQEAVRKWRRDVRKRWKAWYLKVRPYEERNDIDDVGKR